MSKRKSIYDIATIERAKKGKIYPRDTILIALSATEGQINRTLKEGEVDARYATVLADEGINQIYLYYAIESEFDEFVKKYRSGINMKIEVLRELYITVHSKEKQEEIANIMKKIEETVKAEEKAIDNYKKIKTSMLNAMFPN